MTYPQYVEYCRALGIPSLALRDLPPEPHTVQHTPNGYSYDTRRGTRGAGRGPVDLPDMSHLNGPKTAMMQRVIKKAWAKRKRGSK